MKKELKVWMDDPSEDKPSLQHMMEKDYIDWSKPKQEKKVDPEAEKKK